MLGRSTYVVWLITFLAIPIGVLGFLARQVLRNRWKAIALTLAIALVGGWVWDKLAINLGAWQFDPHNILDAWIGGLPLEEWCWIAGTTVLFGSITAILADRSEARLHPLAEPAVSGAADSQPSEPV